MITKTRGIVFRAIKYGETSLITDIYTEQHGLQKYIINGVRSARSRTKASLLQVMSLLDLVVYHRADKQLNRIKEVKSAYVFQSIPFDIRKGAVGLFMAEIARKTIREEESNPRLFHFLFESFCLLDSISTSIANYHLCFLLQLSQYLGFAPGGVFCTDTPIFDLREGIFVAGSPASHAFVEGACSAALYALLQSSLQGAHAVQISAENRRLLLRHLIDFYRLHIENLPTINSHEILQEVFG
jgi:DNA repair protein RecO (recombination protein O)